MALGYCDVLDVPRALSVGHSVLENKNADAIHAGSAGSRVASSPIGPHVVSDRHRNGLLGALAIRDRC